MSVLLMSPPELCAEVAARVRQRRLAMDLTREGLAVRADVSVASIKRFETTGLIAFDALVRIAFALGAEAEVAALFPAPPPLSLAEIETRARPRQRGSRR